MIVYFTDPRGELDALMGGAAKNSTMSTVSSDAVLDCKKYLLIEESAKLKAGQVLSSLDSFIFFG